MNYKQPIEILENHYYQVKRDNNITLLRIILIANSKVIPNYLNLYSEFVNECICPHFSSLHLIDINEFKGEKIEFIAGITLDNEDIARCYLMNDITKESLDVENINLVKKH